MAAMHNSLERFISGVRRQREQLDAWAAAHPELAAAWDAAQIEDDARREAQRLRGSREWALREAGVPPRNLSLLLDGGLRETTAVKAVRAWQGSRRTFLVLSGGAGAGKTVAACLALMGGGVFERCVSAGRLGLYGAEDVARMRALRRARVLVLDDLGAEFQTDVWRAQFDELADERYGHQRRTVITTNLAPEIIRERYGARVADRIRHDGQVIACGVESLRRPGGAQ